MIQWDSEYRGRIYGHSTPETITIYLRPIMSMSQMVIKKYVPVHYKENVCAVMRKITEVVVHEMIHVYSDIWSDQESMVIEGTKRILKA